MSSQTQHSITFDYIIIGGGSAGCVLANRLSQDKNINVCLLEAGPRDSNPLIRVPMGIVAVIRSNQLNWKFWTEPQKHCANRAIYWPRGRTLGGSSAINAMCYTRGNPLDFDAWSALGNKGWSYADVLPYFKKLENYTITKNDPHHNNDGPLTISKQRYVNPLMHVFVQAAKEVGYRTVKDFNNDLREECAGIYDVFQRNGERCSNAAAYLRPAEQRKNLTIITNAYVTNILFNANVAYAVCYCDKAGEHQLNAKREIILSAGSIGSPHLLQLSGIASRELLQKHQIPIIHELPGVGENLQDHLDIHITTLEKNSLAYNFHYRSYFRLLKDVYRYIRHRQGELTSNYAQAGGFFKSDGKQIVPNMQWHFVPSVFTDSGREIKNLFRQYGYTLMSCLLQPKSRGKIMLKSADPYMRPAIDPNYLAHEEDLQAMVNGFKLSRKLLQQEVFAAHRLHEIDPGDAITTDDEIRDYIRQAAQTIYHPVGTCKMGHDKMAVVDNELKVHGVRGLRVVDASIMPINISGNTNATVTMIAEKAADMILGNKY